MKFLSFGLFILLIILFIPFGNAFSDPLEFQSLELWNIEFTGNNTHPSYKIFHTTDNNIVLYMNKSSCLQASEGRIPDNFKEFAIKLLENKAELEKNYPNISFLITNQEIGEVTGIEFSGEFVKYTLEIRQDELKMTKTNAIFTAIPNVAFSGAQRTFRPCGFAKFTHFEAPQS